MFFYTAYFRSTILLECFKLWEDLNPITRVHIYCVLTLPQHWTFTVYWTLQLHSTYTVYWTLQLHYTAHLQFTTMLKNTDFQSTAGDHYQVHSFP